MSQQGRDAPSSRPRDELRKAWDDFLKLPFPHDRIGEDLVAAWDDLIEFDEMAGWVSQVAAGIAIDPTLLVTDRELEDRIAGLARSDERGIPMLHYIQSLNRLLELAKRVSKE